MAKSQLLRSLHLSTLKGAIVDFVFVVNVDMGTFVRVAVKSLVNPCPNKHQGQEMKEDRWPAAPLKGMGTCDD